MIGKESRSYKPGAQVPKRPSTTLSKADSTSILGLRPVTSGPPDFDTLCDAAIAAVRAPTTQAKAPPGVLHLYDQSSHKEGTHLPDAQNLPRAALVEYVKSCICAEICSNREMRMQMPNQGRPRDAAGREASLARSELLLPVQSWLRKRLLDRPVRALSGHASSLLRPGCPRPKACCPRQPCRSCAGKL